MRGINRVLIVGYLGGTPEKLVSKAGNTYTRLSLATHRSRRTDEGQWEDLTDWHRIHVFGRQAEICAERLQKGAALAIEGYLSHYTSSHETLGQISHTSVVADEIHFINGLKSSLDKPSVESLDKTSDKDFDGTVEESGP